MNSTEMMMIDWLNLAKLDVPYDLLFTSSMGCGGHGNKKEDDTMIRKYRKQVDGIVLNKENLPIIFEKILKLNVDSVKYDLSNKKLCVGLIGCGEKCYDFGAVMKFSKNGVTVTYPDCSDYYTAYGLWDTNMDGIEALYDAKNVKNILLYDTANNYDGRIRIDLENGDSFVEEYMDAVLVFDSGGEFVEIIPSKAISPDNDMRKHGYVRVYDEGDEV